MRSKLAWLIAAASVVIIAVIVTFGTTRNGQSRYFTAKVERGDVHDVVDSTGTINAVTTVLVGSQISGRIAKLAADFNSVVRKGQVIAEIDPALFEGALLQAKADLKSSQSAVVAARAELDKARAVLAQTKADYGRAVTLAGEDSISAQAVDLSKANYESAAATVAADIASIKQAEAQVKVKEAAVSVARTNLDYTVIRSPIDGTVVARNVDVGQTVAASLQAPTLFTIAQDLTKMQVYAKVDESNVGKVKVGRKATFKVDAFPKETFEGSVSQVRMNPTTIQNVVTYDAVIDFDNPERKLFPGMTAYVTIPVASAEDVLKVPNAALRYMPQLPKVRIQALQKELGIPLDSRTIVWKLRPDGTIEPVRVALGITDHSYTAMIRIVSGELREGDELITGAVPVENQASGGPTAASQRRRF
jgi:HlyD family secretion protein